MIEKFKELVLKNDIDRARKLFKIKGFSLSKLDSLMLEQEFKFPCPILIESVSIGEKFWLYHKDVGEMEGMPVITPSILRKAQRKDEGKREED